MRVVNGELQLNPFIPSQWESYSFKVKFRNSVVRVEVSKDSQRAFLEAGDPLTIQINGSSASLR
jgi:maltose phosphorylase